MRQIQRADQPKPRDPQHRAERHRPLRGAADQPRRRRREIPLERRGRRGRRRRRNHQAAHPGGDRDHDDQGCDRDLAMAGRDQHAGDRAEQDRQKRAGLDQRVAEQQLMGSQKIGQDRVFDRAEERRLHPHRKQQCEQDEGAAGDDPGGCRQHHRDLDQLDDTGEPGFVAAIGQRARARRAQKERQDKQPARQRDQQPGRQRIGAVRAIGNHQDQRVLQRIIIEGGEELRRE